MAKFYKQELIDARTGEVIYATAIIPDVKDNEEHAKIFRLFSEKVLEDLAGMKGEAKLLLWFIAETTKLPYQSDLWIPVSYKKLAEELGVNERTIYKQIKKLLDLGYIEQFAPRNTTFRIKPDYLYKGVLAKYKSDKMERLMKELLKKQEQETIDNHLKEEIKEIRWKKRRLC